ncbi:MAG: hypothetical protein J0L55_08890 [Caulobacterales bacterium]|nr:hypothetical protein [Caulobacterales bacterium]MCA0373448.1 hypothetical protein [Pseudomonadota bacterium]
MNQKQSGGFGSTNIQTENFNHIGTVVTGLSYEDAKSIAKDVFEENMISLVGEARKTVEERVNKMREELFEELRKNANANLSSFSEPIMQENLFNAQKAYAMTGDETTKNFLVTAIKEASKAKHRSIASISINEAIKCASQLTDNQIKIVALNFVVRHVSSKQVENLHQQNEFYKMLLEPWINEIEVSRGDILHMSSTNCANTSIASVTMQNVISTFLPNLLKTSTIEVLLNQIIQFGGTISKVNKIYSGEGISNLELTSVGIAIGYTFINERTNNFPSIDVFL